MEMNYLFESLSKNKNNEKVATQLLDKINNELLSNNWCFNKDNLDKIYPYLYVCNKYQIFEYLEKEINKEEFINLLDLSDIEGSMLLSLTSNLPKPRKTLILKSNKIKKSILNGDPLFSLEEILKDLTVEEIKLLRKNTDIDNLLITKGLCFNTLKNVTKKRILKDVNILKLYSFQSINEFASNYESPVELANNKAFLDIYFSKMDDDYSCDCKFIKSLSYKMVLYILAKYPKENVILHLLVNTEGLIKKEILKYKDIDKIILRHKEADVLNCLPAFMLKNILEQTDGLFIEPIIDILKTMSLVKLKEIAKNNKNYYDELLKQITKARFEATIFINALPDNLINDLIKNKLEQMNLNALNNLVKASSIFKKELLKRPHLCSKIMEEITLKNYQRINDLFINGKFSDEEKIVFISNIKEFKNSQILNKMMEGIPVSRRKYFYDNDFLRTELLNEDTYQLDDYAISFYLNNIEEVNNLKARVIHELLIKTDYTFNERVLQNEKVVEKLLIAAKEDHKIVTDIINDKNSLVKFFKTANTYKYYDKELLTKILKELNYSEKKELCTNELVANVLEEKYYALYKKMLNNNAFLVNNIDFRIFDSYILDIKLAIINFICKYPDMQQSIISIGKVYDKVAVLVNDLYYATKDLKQKTVFKDILKLIEEECLNNKGNILKLLKDINYDNKKDFNSLVTYFLYCIPRFYQNNNEPVARIKVIKEPLNIKELINYENNCNEQLTSLIKSENSEKVKDYFLQKHFKLTSEEALIVIKGINIAKIDCNLYNEEYVFLTNLNNILNTDYMVLKELDENYKVISMKDSFIIMHNIMKMFGKIYNYELRSNSLNNVSLLKFKVDEVDFYQAKDEFLYLVTKINLDDYLLKNNNYMQSWHYKINDDKTSILCHLISNDHMMFNDDYLFGFNGLNEDGLDKMAVYNNVSLLDNTKDYYAVPSEVIDRTRDYNNAIYLDPYALRTNFNDANLPNIEPDYILVSAKRLSDKVFLQKIVKISLDFKTKKHKNGLPVIIIDIEKNSQKELNYINKLLMKYKSTCEPIYLSKLLTILENNYTAYRNIDISEAKKYDIYLMLNTVIQRICYTNSAYELNEILKIFENEYNKYKDLSKEYKCNFELNVIKKAIETRLYILNNY